MLLRLLVPLAALAAMASFAAREVSPSGAAESAYLAVLAAAVLLPVAIPGACAGLRAGGRRGVGHGGGLGVAAGAGTGGGGGAAPGGGPGRGGGEAAAACSRGRAAPGVAVPLALGVQVLLRGDLLFAPAPTLRTLVALLALPVAGALAVVAPRAAAWRRSWPCSPAGTALVLAPGFNVASTLALIALAAGDLLARADLGRPAKGVALGRSAGADRLGARAGRGGGGLRAGALAAADRAWRSPCRPRSDSGAAPNRPDVMALQASGLLLAGAGGPGAPRTERGPRRGRGGLDGGHGAALVPDLSALAAPLGLAALSLRRERRLHGAAARCGRAPSSPARPSSPPIPGCARSPSPAALSLLGLPPGSRSWPRAVGRRCSSALAGFWRLDGPRLGRAAAARPAGGARRGLRWLPGPAPRAPRSGHGAAGARDPGGARRRRTRPGRRRSPAAAAAGGQRGGGVQPVERRGAGAGDAGGDGAAAGRARPERRTGSCGPARGRASGRRGGRTWRGSASRRRPPGSPGWRAISSAQRYRSRLDAGRPERASQLRIERAPRRAPGLVLAVYQLEVRR